MVCGRVCGVGDCLWLPFGAVAMGKKRTLTCLAKITSLRGPWESFMHP